MALLALSALPAHAQQYPTKPIRVIVPSAAGGGGDIVARAIGAKLSESWGQQIVVDNRSGILGPELAAKADPDGYTLTVNIVHVPYKGVPQGLLDVMGGRLHMMFASPVASIPASRDGKLRILAVTTAKRFAALPNTPTMVEAGVPGYEFTGWMGLFAPVRTPEPVIARLHSEVTRILKLPDVRDKLSGDGAEPVGSTPREFAAYVAADLKKWSNLAKVAGIRAD